MGLPRWQGESAFFEQVRALGLGPGWRLHVIEDPANMAHVFSLTHDLTGARYAMTLQAVEFADTTVAVRRILDWVMECALPPFDPQREETPLAVVPEPGQRSISFED